jgi:hypothetical protein
MALHSYLIDSKILLRAALRDNPEHVLVCSALTKLISAETVLCYPIAPPRIISRGAS